MDPSERRSVFLDEGRSKRWIGVDDVLQNIPKENSIARRV